MKAAYFMFFLGAIAWLLALTDEDSCVLSEFHAPCVFEICGMSCEHKPEDPAFYGTGRHINHVRLLRQTIRTLEGESRYYRYQIEVLEAQEQMHIFGDIEFVPESNLCASPMQALYLLDVTGDDEWAFWSRHEDSILMTYENQD